jgi:hypothetical protein
MDLSTIAVPVEEAKGFLDDYRKMRVEERTQEDEAIAAGYRAAARGLPVISMSTTIEAGGYFDNGLPRIAVVRADATECWVRVARRELVFSADQWTDNRGALVGKQTVRVVVDERERHAWRGKTIVPIIPPRFRPGRYRLHKFHVLWEVEKWDPTPPKDPALLRHIRGDLWSVMATWDLTELERAVLSQRAR